MLPKLIEDNFEYLNNYNESYEKYLNAYYEKYARHIRLCSLIKPKDKYLKEYAQFVKRLEACDIEIKDEYDDWYAKCYKYKGSFVFYVVCYENIMEIYAQNSMVKRMTKFNYNMVYIMLKYFLTRETPDKIIEMCYFD